MNESGVPFMLKDETGKPVDFSFFPISSTATATGRR